MPCIGDLQCRLCARRKRQTRLCKLIDLHFDGQKLTGIGFGFDVHNAVFIQTRFAARRREASKNPQPAIYDLCFV